MVDVNKNPGETVTVTVNVQNTGNTILDVGMKCNIVGVVTFTNQTTGVLAIGGTMIVTFSGVVPTGVVPGNYDVVVQAWNTTFTTMYDEMSGIETQNVIIGTQVAAQILTVVVS